MIYKLRISVALGSVYVPNKLAPTNSLSFGLAAAVLSSMRSAIASREATMLPFGPVLFKGLIGTYILPKALILQ